MRVCSLSQGRRRVQLEEWFDDLRRSIGARLLPVTMAVGERWAVLSAQAQRRGTPLAIIDGLIAATAFEHNLVVATRNMRDFAVSNVPLLNPWDAVAARPD